MTYARMSGIGGKRTGSCLSLNKNRLILNGWLRLLVALSADCAQTTEQDTEDDPHDPRGALKELENA